MRAPFLLLLLAACDLTASSDWDAAYSARCEFVDLDGNPRLTEVVLDLEGPIEGAQVTGAGVFEVYGGACTVWQDGVEQETCAFEMIYCVDEAGCENLDEPFQTGAWRFGVPLNHTEAWSGPRFYLDGQNTTGEPVVASSGTCSWTDETFT